MLASVDANFCFACLCDAASAGVTDGANLFSQTVTVDFSDGWI